MKIQLKILAGSASGRVHVFSQEEITVGRHPASDIQFDPEADLQVSARHAVLKTEERHWIVEDRDSSNGTFLNGHRITGPTRISDTDQLRFGVDGPSVEFRLVSEQTANTIKPIAPTRPPRPTHSGHGKTAHRVKVEVAKQTKTLRRALTTAVVAIVAVAAIAIYIAVNQNRARERDVAQLRSQIDSLLTSSDSIVNQLQGQLAGLATALQRSQDEARDLQGELAEARASGNSQRVVSLTRRLTDLMTTVDRQQSAAQIDHVRIRERNQRAVAIIFVEFGPGDVSTGTAFAVRPDAIMVTNRHVVAGPDGTRTPTRIAVKFADSEQSFGAEIVAVSDQEDIDLALVRVSVGSNVPVVQSLNTRPDTIPQGSPTATIGFPEGPDLAARGLAGGNLASTTLTAGIVSRFSPRELQLHGYGAAGASGSPIFDANGEVIGILYGGTRDPTGDRLLFAVPSTFAIEMLRGVN